MKSDNTFNTSDHDLLIELKVILHGMSKTLDDVKMAQSSFEQRVRKIEDVFEAYPLKAVNDRLQSLDKKINDSQVALRVIVAAASIVGGIIGFLLSTYSGVLNIVRGA